MDMDRKHVHLPKQQNQALIELSKRTGRKVPELIREAIQEYLERKRREMSDEHKNGSND